MNGVESKLEMRMPVWRALSELFLDTELQPEDYDRISAVLASSPYSEKEIENILRFEVSPVCGWNLFDIAGEWEGFDDDWLRTKISPRLDKRPWFHWHLFSICREKWNILAKKVSMLRVNKVTF